jgi:hypothetical protein
MSSGPPPLLHQTKTGVKKKLAASASYPRVFGVAIGSILPPRGTRPDSDEISIDYTASASNDMAALDDLLKGSKSTWWRDL